jgi:hypothetical protein
MVRGVGVPVMAFSEISENSSRKNSLGSSSTVASAVCSTSLSFSITSMRKSLGAWQTWPLLPLCIARVTQPLPPSFFHLGLGDLLDRHQGLIRVVAPFPSLPHLGWWPGVLSKRSKLVTLRRVKVTARSHSHGYVSAKPTL